ncbi:PAS domain S-box protein [Rhodocytophaga rosea]|uniref:histidine kinase n=1 Tax=Rhodocytophaga rosea TaxID=2704465 RepID=A0A6C0GEE1_9BACT|nr:PAS domain-containing sensor histidine kinase [Rhodocytophaga rosea]QHT66379.1 PAS domain S-box protein [Rhodocytophaga rosea]
MIEEEDAFKHSGPLWLEGDSINKLIIESVKDYAIFMLDTDGRILTWNIGAERIKGYQAKEIIGKHFSVFYPPEALADQYPQYELRKAKQEGRFEDEGWRVRKDGSTFWANVVITAIYNTDTQHIGFSKVTRDLTEKLRNEELMKKNKELHKINIDLDNFIYTASHDLKAPIVNLEGLLSRLSKKLILIESSAEMEILEMMKTSILNLKKTIANLVEITKSQQNTGEAIEAISFSEIIDHAKEDIDLLIVESDAQFREELMVKEVLFNRAYLKSILHNLLTNAIKYRSPSRDLQITIRTYREASYIVLSVKDNGLGLSKTQQSNLFSLFRRFHTHVEGSGIGLYLVKRIIENRQGRIEIESEINKGSEFKIFFVSE